MTSPVLKKTPSELSVCSSTSASFYVGERASCSCVPDLLECLSKIRRREICIDADDFAVVVPTDSRAWAHLFAEFILTNARCSTRRCIYRNDDMIWYVTKHLFSPNLMNANAVSSGRNANSCQPSPLVVYRRQSQKQPPPGCQTINWEETTYLNLILHHVEYILTCAVCTKTSPQNLQILRKISQRVYASPSRRSMDRKGESEEISYPYIYFSVDSFELVFSDIVLRDGESVCVELLARAPNGILESAVFLGSVRYEVLRQVYDARISQSWTKRWIPGSRMGAKGREFVRMRGPQGRGYAEMAVCEVPQGSTGDLSGTSPSASKKDLMDEYNDSLHPGNDALDMIEAAEEQYRSRRCSDTNLMSHSYHSEADVRYPRRYRGNSSSCADTNDYLLKKSRSEADTAQQNPVVEASAIDEELDEGPFSRLWGTRGFSQAWHWLREKRRATSIPLNASLTFVTVPWLSVIEGLFDRPHRPVLSFNIENCDFDASDHNGVR